MSIVRFQSLFVRFLIEPDTIVISLFCIAMIVVDEKREALTAEAILPIGFQACIVHRRRNIKEPKSDPLGALLC
jgi:hypothetical protein